MLAVLVLIAGVVMTLNGLSIGVRAESAMHQIYSAVYVAGGVVTMAVAFVVYAIDRVAAQARALRQIAADAAKDRRAEADRIENERRRTGGV